MTKKLIDQIRHYAENREDLLVADSPMSGAELLVLQVRRVVKFEVLGASAFNPHERKVWHYYAQPILVETRVKEKLTPKQIDTRDLMKMMGLVWLPCREMADFAHEVGVQEQWTLGSARPEKMEVFTTTKVNINMGGGV